MKNSKLLVIILTILLVVCVGGLVVLNNAQAGLKASESQLKSEIETLSVESTDLKSELEDKVTELDTQKQTHVDEVASLESAIDDAIAKLEKTEEALAEELLRQEDWAVYIEPDKILGEWITVNLVDKEDEFDANEQVSRELWLKSIRFSNKMASLNTGEGYSGGLFWADDHIVSDETAMGFKIQEIDGSEYLFLEWKSGDYIRNNNMSYYVFKKAD